MMNERDPMCESLAGRLSGGDRRSPGAADEIAVEVVAAPALTTLLVDLMRHANPIVRMRAADALEKASRKNPHLLAPFADALVQEIGPSKQQEIRWHIAQMIPRLPLDAALREEATVLLQEYLGARSRIVVVEALTALAALARDDPALRAWLLPELHRAAQGPPSVRARTRRLLAGLTQDRDDAPSLPPTPRRR